MQGMTDENGTTHLVFFQDSVFIPYICGDNFFNPDALNLANLKEWSVFNTPTCCNYIPRKDYLSVIFSHNSLTRYLNIQSADTNNAILINNINGFTLIDSIGQGRTFRLIHDPADSSNIYASLGDFTILSVDQGITWPNITIDIKINYPLLSINPYTDIYYSHDEQNQLLISFDKGKNFLIASNDDLWNKTTQLLFDKNQSYVYAITNKEGQNSSTFLVSNNSGKPFSWTKIKIEAEHWEWDYWGGPKYYHLALDDSVSGKLYASFMNELYISEDFGFSFNLAYTFPSQVTGLYKKPKTDTLYISNAYKIYSFTESDSTIKTIKDIAPENLSDFYPVHTGDFWLYKISDYNYDTGYYEYYNKKSVIGDTLFPNNKSYKIVKEGYDFHYQRFDTLNGLVLEFLEWDSTEFVLFDLTFVIGDKFDTAYSFFESLRLIAEEDSLIFNETLPQKRFKAIGSLRTDNIYLSNKLGKVYEDGDYDFGEYYIELQGAVIDGVVYGDTTVTAIENNRPKLQNFTLAQNYPNPFNPQTIISYNLAKNCSVKIKIFDLAGREVKSLVSENQIAGQHSVTFIADNLASGVYYYRINAGDFVQTKKMILLR